MKTTIVQIGNSKGLRIPKTILEQCRIGKDVILEVENDNIIIKPTKRQPRRDWGRYFRKMSKSNEDKLLIDDKLDLDLGKWEW